MQAAFRGGREARPACGVACMALLVPGEATAAVAHVIWPCGLSAACTRYLLYRLVGLFPVISAMTRARALYHLPCASRFVLLHFPMRFKIAVPLQFNTGPRAIAPCDTEVFVAQTIFDTEVAVARRSRVQGPSAHGAESAGARAIGRRKYFTRANEIDN